MTQDENRLAADTLAAGPDGTLPRPRIDTLLAEAVKKPLVKVVAGAGYGKTRSLTHFLSHMDMDVAWVSLSELDDLPAHFWESCLHAVKKADPDLAKALGGVGWPDSEVAFERLVATLSSFLSPKQGVLVLDDYHLIANPDIRRQVERLAAERVPDFCIVLLCREEPDVGATSRDVLYTVSQQDLCFTPEETSRYLESQGLHLPKEILEQFYALTEGWGIAIYLLALSCRKEGAFPADPLAGVKADIFALIEKEVFEGYPEKAREGLVRISVLTSFQPGLVKAVMGSRYDIFDKAGPGGQFIRMDPFAGEYTINPMFIEFLKRKFDALPAETQNTCHERAAKWYAGHGLLEEAVTHYERSGEYGRMLDVIEQSPSRVATRQKCQWAIGVYEKVPHRVTQNRPLTQVAYGSLLYMAGRLEDCRVQIDRVLAGQDGLAPADTLSAQAARPKKGRPPVPPDALGEAWMLKGLWGYFSMDSEMVFSFKRATQLLPGGSRLLDSHLPFTMGNPSMFIFFGPQKGEVERVSALLHEAAPYTTQVLHGGGAGLDLLFDAEAAWNRGDFAKAEQLADRCRFKARQSGQHTIELDAGFVLVKLHLARGERDHAEETLAEMHRSVYSTNDMLLSTVFRLMETWVFLVTGQVERVPGWVSDGEFRGSALLGIGSWFEQFLYARLLLQTGRYKELEAFLPVLDEICARRNDLVDNRIEYYILSALLAFAQNDREAAGKALGEAYWLSCGNGLVMPFAVYGKAMNALAAAAGSFEQPPAPRDWLSQAALKSAAWESHTHGARRGTSAQELGITPKEGEVLRCLCEGMSNKEIAAALEMTLGTAKWYVNQLLMKLAVKNRTEAALAATHLGLVQR